MNNHKHICMWVCVCVSICFDLNNESFSNNIIKSLNLCALTKIERCVDTIESTFYRAAITYNSHLFRWLFVFWIFFFLVSYMLILCVWASDVEPRSCRCLCTISMHVAADLSTHEEQTVGSAISSFLSVQKCPAQPGMGAHTCNPNTWEGGGARKISHSRPA